MEKKTNMILKTGIVGSVVAAICCFTPILVILLGVLGLGAATGYLDYVLLPALGFFLILMAYGGYKERQAGQMACACEEEKHEK
jgi:mercuric ion transport protein